MKQSNYPEHLSDQLVSGFENGFLIGHGPDFIQNYFSSSQSRIPSHLQDYFENKLHIELCYGRIKGPYTTPPLDNFKISPLTLREKSCTGKYRIIQNLSFPYDDTSVNSQISDEHKSVKYSNISEAIRLITQLPAGAYSAKTDIKNAFSIIPIHPNDHHKLGILYKEQFYYAKTLPQGAASSCRIFELFSTALQHIIQYHAPHIRLIHYLDDFLIIAPSQQLCQAYLDIVHTIFNDIGVPLAQDKTTIPSTCTTFLGIELNTILQCAKLPIEKLIQYSNDISQVLMKRTITKRTLQSILGKLNFATSVVPGRPFLRRLICLLSHVSQPHYYIKLTPGAQLDLRMWHTFLKTYNGTTFFRYLKIDSYTLSMSSDACKHGFGATFKHHWIQSTYPDSWKDYHITVLELYPIYIMLHMFAFHIQNMTVRFYCDNESVCFILNKLSSKDPIVMSIIRPLVLCFLTNNIHISAIHVPGKCNTICDKISRFQIKSADLISAGLNPYKTPIPGNLLPEKFVPS